MTERRRRTVASTPGEAVTASASESVPAARRRVSRRRRSSQSVREARAARLDAPRREERGKEEVNSGFLVQPESDSQQSDSTNRSHIGKLSSMLSCLCVDALIIIIIINQLGPRSRDRSIV